MRHGIARILMAKITPEISACMKRIASGFACQPPPKSFPTGYSEESRPSLVWIGNFHDLKSTTGQAKSSYKAVGQSARQN